MSVASIWCSKKNPQKSPPIMTGFGKSLMNCLDLAHVCIATVLCRRVISEAARRQQIEGLLRDGRVVEEVYFSRTNAMPYGIIIGP